MRTSRSEDFLVPAVVGILVACAVAFHWVTPVELFLRDLMVRLVPEHSARNVAVVAIDDASLQREGPWPWPRKRLATIVTAAARSGARVVGIDLLLVDAHDGDRDLAAACRAIRCVAAATLDDHGKWILPTEALRRDLGLAHAAFELDDDGILRRISATKQDARLSLPAFSAALQVRASDAALATGRQILPGFKTPPRLVPVASAASVLRGDASALHALRVRVVIIGVTATALGDRVMTPRSQRHESEPGVLVHAAAVESLLTGDRLRETSPVATGIFAAILAAVALRIGRREEVVTRTAGGLLLIALPFTAGIALVFVHELVPVVAVSSSVVVVVLGLEGHRAMKMARHGQVAMQTLETELGMQSRRSEEPVGSRLEELATAIVRRRAGDVESKRVLAHELKTPLSAMRNLSQLLAGFELTSDERRRLALLLADEAEKLQEMITRLLEIEQLAVRSRVDAANIDVSDLVSRRLNFLTRGITRPIEAEIESGLLIRGDAALIDRVLDNLLGNALKFTPQGSPIRVEVRRENTMVIVEVMDRGPGIPPAEREKIFGPFARGTTSSGIDGLGLGLALVNQAARWHGGAVDVRDREGGGCIFRLQIPVAASHVVAEAV